jgi:hypothetical protein
MKTRRVGGRSAQDEIDPVRAGVCVDLLLMPRRKAIDINDHPPWHYLGAKVGNQIRPARPQLRKIRAFYLQVGVP